MSTDSTTTSIPSKFRQRVLGPRNAPSYSRQSIDPCSFVLSFETLKFNRQPTPNIDWMQGEAAKAQATDCELAISVNFIVLQSCRGQNATKSTIRR
ncbi:hypothetical protein FRC18_011670 [Serendipita sp. 400]|nr:hypothetical protein FRC18_011670 [Serendipita sp. 400]